MMNLTLDLVLVPQEHWAKVPADRPLRDLAQDARGVERRIVKGVNPNQNRMIYHQMATRIEELATELALGRAATQETLVGGEARLAIRFFEEGPGLIAQAKPNFSQKATRVFFGKYGSGWCLS